MKMKFVLKLAFGIGLLLWVLSREEMSGEYLRTVLTSPVFWGVVLAGNSLTLLVAALRWGVLLRRKYGRSFPLLKLIRYSWVSLFLGLVAPGTFGTDAARVYYLKVREDLKAFDSTKTIVWERIATTLALVLLVAPALWVWRGGSWSSALPVAAVAWLATLLRPEISLSLLGHFVKLGMVLAILLLGGIETPGLSGLMPQLMLGMGIEAIPISWQGLGVGHAAFAALLKESGPEVYSLYFVGKTLFKLAGGIVWLSDRPATTAALDTRDRSRRGSIHR